MGNTGPVRNDPIDSAVRGPANGGLWRALPWVVTGLLIVVIWSVHARLIAVGGFHIYDEFHTLDRSSAFARHGDWLTVYSMNEVSFRKPPLQYWMTGWLMGRGADDLVALRAPSLFFAFCEMLTVALLAAAVMPWQRWAMPAAVLLFAGSRQYWDHALSGMLETGAGVFATLAIASAIFALRRAGWWYVAALAIALGTLQKAAIGLVLVALFLLVLHLTGRWHDIDLRALRTNRSFRRALALAIAGTLAWPLYQGLTHEFGAFDEFFGRQMVDRFTPTDSGNEIRSLGTLRTLIIGDEPWLRWPGIVALVLMPRALRRPELVALPVIVAVFVLGMMLAGGHVTARYVLIFLPWLSVAIATVALSVLPRVWTGLLVVLAISVASGGPIKPAASLSLATPANYQTQIVALTRVGATLQPSETLVVCIPSGPRRIVPAIASHFASNGRPFERLDKGDKDLETRLNRPLRGLCKPDDLETFAGLFRNLVIREELSGYVMWTADGLR